VHPASQLDELVHQRARLGVLAIAAEAKRVEFRYLQSELKMTAGNMTPHLGALEKGGLIKIVKGYQGRRPRTWVSITPKGRFALRQEILTLRAIIEGAPEPQVTRRERPSRQENRLPAVSAAATALTGLRPSPC
jgi:DNA-binding MarR family transcriptional regulator